MVNFDGLGCHKCTDQMKKVRGCLTDLEKPYKLVSGTDVYSLNKCFVKVITMESRLYMEAYGHYKNGFLPNGGGWANESIKLCEMINLIDAKVNEFQELEMQKVKM